MAIGYTTTDGEGHYTLSIRSGADSVVIAVSGMSVKAVRSTVPNVSGRHDFEVEESLFELDEVRVKAPKMEMKGDDTVSYNVASFRSQEDMVIEDVLRKLPGITVRDNGQILYKAKPIAGLTIDGMDLLKGRYGIATRNISPDHIASVEILENHQAIKALKDLVPSDKTYINLKLKASSRGVFLLSAAAGGGYGDGGLWNAEAAPMYFGHSSQHILTGKTNNTGDDLAYELEDLTSGTGRLNLTSGTGRLNPVLSSATLASPPAIDKDRYYRNTSHSASLNELFRTSGGTDINLNLSYLNDTELRDNTSEIRWMLPDSSLRQPHTGGHIQRHRHRQGQRRAQLQEQRGPPLRGQPKHLLRRVPRHSVLGQRHRPGLRPHHAKGIQHGQPDQAQRGEERLRDQRPRRLRAHAVLPGNSPGRRTVGRSRAGRHR